MDETNKNSDVVAHGSRNAPPFSANWIITMQSALAQIRDDYKDEMATASRLGWPHSMPFLDSECRQRVRQI